jgi:hypothetical protein
MANLDSANGFLPYNAPHGGNGQPTVSEHPLLATNAEIGKGSPVKVAAGGVELAAAGDALLGVAAEYKAASAGGVIKVWSDPQQLFVAQTDNGTGTATALAAVGLNIDHVGSGVSNNRSTAELDEDSAATTATLSFKIIDLSDEYQGNARNAFGEFNRLVVKINNHQLQGHTGTAGI